MTPTDMWRIADLVWTVHDDEVAVATLPDAQVFRLDGGGAIIWQVLADTPGATTSRLVEDVAATAGVPTDVVFEDVVAYLGHLDSLGLVIRERV